jgi:hypothetical protein
MLKKLCLALLLVLSCMSSQAQGTNIYGMMSPKLKQFLATHPRASKILSDALSEAFTNRTVRLYYFYTGDESLPRAVHNSLIGPSVVIWIREDQEPSDQFFCLLFETLNSEGDRRFGQLMEEAHSGKISRTEFAREMTRQEFQAAKRMKKLLPDCKFSKTEIAKSSSYSAAMKCPEDFKAYLDYSAGTVRFFERAYDTYRETQQRPNTALEPTPTAP